MENRETKKENKSLSLNSSTVEMVNAYPNYSYGMGDMPFSWKVDSMLEAFYKITKYSIPELRNYFTIDEAAAICDVENATMHTLSIEPKKALYLSVLGGCEYECIDKKWNIDKDKLLDKISNLTQLQAYMVQTLTAMFWDRNSDTFEMKEIAELFYIDYEDEKVDA